MAIKLIGFLARLLLAIAVIISSMQVHGTESIELTSTWKAELALTKDEVQKFEQSWQPEIDWAVDDNIDMTLIARLRFDTEKHLGFEGERIDSQSAINGVLLEGEHFELALREWYIDTASENVFWRLGKQQVVWGQADGLKVLDVINPQSYREFILQDFDDSRIPLWMVNAELAIGEDDSLQVLWIFEQSYHDFANVGSDYQLTSPLLVPQPVEGIELTDVNSRKPDNGFKDSELGLRYSKFYHGWDLTFNYLYHYLDTPVFYQKINLALAQTTAWANPESAEFTVAIDAIYQRNHLIGASASKAFGDFTIRTELGFSSDTYHLLDNSQPAFIEYSGIAHSKDFSSVIGLDWTGLDSIGLGYIGLDPSFLENTMLSFQWFQSSLLGIDKTITDALVRPKHNQIFSLLYQQSFVNETWQLELLTLYGLEQKDSSVQIELSYMLEDNLQLWLGADVFNGEASSLFGQFNDTDRVIVGFELGF